MTETETMTAEGTTVTETPEGMTVYEVGVHFTPTIPEEDVAARFGDLKATITDLGGNTLADGFPILTPLAYTIVTKTGKFDRAYFGWVKFTLTPESVAAVKEACDHMESVIRFIIVKADPEVTVPFKRAPSSALEADRPAPAEVVAKGPVSEEELDKTLEGIIA